MDLDEQNEPAIDPETRAFVFSLVSALGGPSASDDGRYVLGDDALAVLKDIKRWMRVYDNQLNSLAVSRLLAEANFVKGDLLEILAQWPEDAVEGSLRSKLALTCVDLLTQLTWPPERGDDQSMKLEHFFHMPFIQAAQASYKRAILHHDTTQILRQIVRAGLPPMAQPRKDRSPTEDMIIRVVLFSFRNIAMIEKAPGIHAEETDEEIARAATIDAFHKQDVFNLLLTIGSGIGDEYVTHDVELMEILFHLLKGVDTQTLFMEKEELISVQTAELKGLISKEKSLLAGYQKFAPSRHTRFVPMMWMQRDDGKRTTVVGQKAYANDQVAIDEMDRSKKFKKPRRGKRGPPEKAEVTFDAKTPLTQSARRHLRNFVEQFMDSSFNPLFLSIRKAIEREAERVAHSSRFRGQYFYLISWFLEAECARRKKQAALNQQNPGSGGEVESFALVAAVLNQETFALLNRSMQTAQDESNWRDLNAQMRCFSQILVTVQDMADSPLEDDQEIAENILSRIFYEQSTHDRVIALLRSYKDQGFSYLNACTELAHTFLRVIERYSKTNVDMQVRRIRRVRKKKIEEASLTADDSTEGETAAIRQMDVQEAQRVSTERKFDFARYASRFINQSSIDTFVALLRYYNDLSAEQLKRAHRFFYRVAFKMDMEVFLFRMDIILLFQRLVKGPESLDMDSNMYKDWEELARQVFRKFVKKMQERPVLGIEVLFSKMPNTMFYLEHGYDQDLPTRVHRAPAELEVRGDMSREDQITVVVSALVNQSKSDHLVWLKAALLSVYERRKSLAEAATARRTKKLGLGGSEDSAGQPAEDDDDVVEPAHISITLTYSSEEQKIACQRDKYLRLLLTLIGLIHKDFLENDPPYTDWTVMSYTPYERLKTDHDLIHQTEFSPPAFEDGKNAEDFLRNKPKPFTSAQTHSQGGPNGGFGSDGDLDSDDGFIQDDEHPDARPTGVDPSVRAHKGPKKRTGRTRHEKDNLLDERGLEERRRAREKLEAERARKIKSGLYISKSDDESDEERDRAFFEMEARLRKETGSQIVRAQQMTDAVTREVREKRGKTGKATRKKRKSEAVVESAGSSDGDGVGRELPARAKKQKQSKGLAALLAESSDDDNDVGALFEHDTDTDAVRPGPSQSSSDEAESSDSGSDTPPSSERPSLGRSSGPATTAQGEENGEAEDIVMSDVSRVSGDSDKENAGRPPASSAPAKRRGFKVIHDDEDEE